MDEMLNSAMINTAMTDSTMTFCCFLRLIQKRKNIDIRYITTYCFTTEYFEIESSVYLRQYSDYIQ